MLEWWRRAAQYGDPPDIVEERALCFHKDSPLSARPGHIVQLRIFSINKENPELTGLGIDGAREGANNGTFGSYAHDWK